MERTLPLGNQTVDEGKFFFTEAPQLVNENGMIAVERGVGNPGELMGCPPPATQQDARPRVPPVGRL